VPPTTHELTHAVMAATRGRLPATQSARQAVWLHVPLIEHMIEEPETVFGIARENLPVLRKRHPECAPALDEWRTILDAGHRAPELLIAAWTAPDDWAVTLRACSPFTGVLSAEEVVSALRSYRSWCRESTGKRQIQV